ncbi:Uncharacterized protein BCGR_1709 [Mycobacterium tuberculosis variant bovis BCG]|nr:Uncharacterized protein BCGR_1709 [Mycobacterium tuberculosis variant bovis BCG]
MIAAVLVLQHLAVVSNRAYPHGSVVVESRISRQPQENLRSP